MARQNKKIPKLTHDCKGCGATTMGGISFCDNYKKAWNTFIKKIW